MNRSPWVRAPGGPAFCGAHLSVESFQVQLQLVVPTAMFRWLEQRILVKAEVPDHVGGRKNRSSSDLRGSRDLGRRGSRKHSWVRAGGRSDAVFPVGAVRRNRIGGRPGGSRAFSFRPRVANEPLLAERGLAGSGSGPSDGTDFVIFLPIVRAELGG